MGRRFWKNGHCRIQPSASFDPYWDNTGAIFEDNDRYRIVLQNSVCPVIASADYT